MKQWIILAAGIVLVSPALAFDWGRLLNETLSRPSAEKQGSSDAVNSLSSTEINSGLKEALTRGADAAVAQLGKPDGFFADRQLRIPLPEPLKQAESAMRLMGMGRQADDLVLAMNRPAEAAVPEARILLINAVKEMTLEDARGILTGGKTSATDFFRSKTETRLAERFQPIVKAHTDKVGLAQQYNRYAGVAAQYNLIGKGQSNVEQYVTQQALDRLYTVIGEKEAAFAPTRCRLAATC